MIPCITTVYKKDRPMIAKWFIPKLEFINGHEATSEILDIARETEKAYLVIINYQSLTNPDVSLTSQQWVPKCAVTTPRVEDTRKTANMKRHQELIDFAKAKGIKGVKTNLKTSTLVTMITSAGFEVPV